MAGKIDLKKLVKNDKIIFNNIKPNNNIENNKYKDNNIKKPNNKKIFKYIFVKRENIIKPDENKNNNIIIKKNDNLINNNNKTNNNNTNIIKNIVPKEDNKENEKIKNNIEEKEVRKKKKKSSYTTEKELQIAYEKKFLENINKNYSDKEYENDMKQCLLDKRKKFMKDNFPVMFQKDKFYLYSILKKKRLASNNYFIDSDFFKKNNNKNIYEIFSNNYNDVSYISEKKDVKSFSNKIFKIFKTKKIKTKRI